MSIEVQSDSNVQHRISQVVSKRKQYSDLDLSLTLHPDFHDIIPLLDTDAVKASVKNLILTNFLERPFQPKVGSNLRGLLFEPADRFTIIAIKEGIRNVLARYEPRVDQVTIQIQDNADNNRYDITLGFRIISVNQSVNMTIYLSRVR